MNMDETASSLDTTDNLGADAQRLASASSFNTVAPARRRRAVLCVMADLVIFGTQQQRDLTLQGFIDFMKRSKWKLYLSHKREEGVGNYHSVIDGNVTSSIGACNRSCRRAQYAGAHVLKPQAAIRIQKYQQPHHRWTRRVEVQQTAQ